MNFENKIIIGDCVDVMKAMPEECVQLVVTSPPYGNMRDYRGNENQKIYDFEAVAAGIFRILKPGGILVWVERNQRRNFRYSLDVEKHSLYFDSIGLRKWQTLFISNKNAQYRDGKDQIVSVQDCPVFTKGKPDLNHIHFLFSKSSSVGRKRKKLKSRHADGMAAGERYRKYNEGRVTGEFRRSSDIIDVDENYYIKQEIGGPMLVSFSGGTHIALDDVQKEHSAILPWKVAQLFILMFSSPGDMVFDPFAGSGTVPALACQLHREFCGAEIDPLYAGIAESLVRKQSPLFFAGEKILHKLGEKK